MTQTSTHSYDCTGFWSICCNIGCWNWSLHLLSDGFFSLLKMLQKEALASWEPDITLTWNAGLFWPKAVKKPSQANTQKKRESIKNIKQPPRLQRAPSHLTLPSEQIGFTVRTSDAEICMKSTEGFAHWQQYGVQSQSLQFCRSDLRRVQSVSGVKPRSHSQLRMIKLSCN